MGWAGLGRTEAANPDTKTCLKEPAQVPSLLPQLVALFPYTTPEGSRLAPPLRTVNLFCSLALHSLPGRPEPGQAQVGGTRGPPLSAAAVPLLPFLGISAIKAVGVAPSPELGSPGPAVQRGAYCEGPRPPASKEEHLAGCRARCSRPEAVPCAFHPTGL